MILTNSRPRAALNWHARSQYIVNDGIPKLKRLGSRRKVSTTRLSSLLSPDLHYKDGEGIFAIISLSKITK